VQAAYGLSRQPRPEAEVLLRFIKIEAHIVRIDPWKTKAGNRAKPSFGVREPPQPAASAIAQ
jgi:hypothetical protein